MENPTSPEIPSVLQARRFELVGSDGKVRAVLGEWPGPATEASPVCGLSLLDRHGRARASLALLPTGPSDHCGRNGVEIGVADRPAGTGSAGPYIVVNFSDGCPAVAWRASDDGFVTMSVAGTVAS